MERARELGYARSIGVSNFAVGEIDDLLQQAEQPPVVNQVLFNPFAYRKRLFEACAANHIVLEAYSPLGTGRHLHDPAVAQIAAAHGRTPAQVLLRWGIQHGVPQIPKSTHQPRIVENAQVFDFELSEEDMQTLDGLDQTGGTDRAREDKWW
jgi:2,5-diketo-D-gluconate reductase A